MSITRDYELAISSVALVDRSDRAKLVISGAGAGEFLEGQVTNAVAGLAPGEGRYAAFLNPKGKLRADARILRLAESYWLDAEGYAEAVVKWVLENFSVGLEVSSDDVTAVSAILSLVGPDAATVLEAVPPETEHSHVDGAHGRYVRTDLGVDIICPAESVPAVKAALAVHEADPAVAEILRVETGRPRLGIEMDGDTIPQEAGLNERAVDFEKGCYVGQETVARLHYRGRPNRHLRGLRLGGPAERGADITFGDKAVGKVGTAVESPRLGHVALALVRREAGPGERVSVGGTPATVTDLPFDAHPD